MDATLLARYSAGSNLAPAIRRAAVVLIVVLTMAAAQVSVPLPFTPVPLTLQPMVVLLGGAVLGARLGMLSQILYLLAGIVGLGVFAVSPVLPQGAARLIGPTGGYLLAYPLAAYVTGRLAERGWDRRYLTAVLAMAAGLGVIFTGGVLWFAFFAAPAPVGFSRAVMAGFVPFLGADALKLLVAAAILPACWRLVGRPRV